MKHYHLNTVGSTNDYAKELLETNSLVAVSANYQTAGRGRKNRNWFGNFGDNLYLSIGIDHSKIKVKSNLVLYQAIGCLAVKRTIETLTGFKSTRIKYPNDLIVKSEDQWKKLCGVLAEHSFIGNQCQTTVIGVGVNIRQTEFTGEIAETAISLSNMGFDLDIDNILPILINNFEYFFSLSSKELMRLWKNELKIENKDVRIVGENAAYIVKQMKEDGQLELINTQTGKIRIINNGDSIRYDLD